MGLQAPALKEVRLGSRVKECDNDATNMSERGVYGRLLDPQPIFSPYAAGSCLLSPSYCPPGTELQPGMACFRVDSASRGGHVEQGQVEMRRASELIACCERCTDAPPTKRCGRCKVAGYCSAECQRRHHREHKKVCVPPEEKVMVFKAMGLREGGKKTWEFQH
jgi:hypothetical protein